MADVATYLTPLEEEGYLICMALMSMLDAAEDIKVDFLVHQLNKTVSEATGGVKIVQKEDESVEAFLALLNPLQKISFEKKKTSAEEE
jgi:hypothetical protein